MAVRKLRRTDELYQIIVEYWCSLTSDVCERLSGTYWKNLNGITWHFLLCLQQTMSPYHRFICLQDICSCIKRKIVSLLMIIDKAMWSQTCFNYKLTDVLLKSHFPIMTDRWLPKRSIKEIQSNILVMLSRPYFPSDMISRQWPYPVVDVQLFGYQWSQQLSSVSALFQIRTWDPWLLEERCVVYFVPLWSLQLL